MPELCPDADLGCLRVYSTVASASRLRNRLLFLIYSCIYLRCGLCRSENSGHIGPYIFQQSIILRFLHHISFLRFFINRSLNFNDNTLASRWLRHTDFTIVLIFFYQFNDALLVYPDNSIDHFMLRLTRLQTVDYRRRRSLRLRFERAHLAFKHFCLLFFPFFAGLFQTSGGKSGVVRDRVIRGIEVEVCGCRWLHLRPEVL